MCAHVYKEKPEEIPALEDHRALFLAYVLHAINPETCAQGTRISRTKLSTDARPEIHNAATPAHEERERDLSAAFLRCSWTSRRI